MDVNQIVLVFGFLFLLIGGFFGVISIILSRINMKTQSWHAVNGEILESKLEEEVEKYAYDTDEFNTTDSTTYKSNIKYSYYFNGRQFESNKTYASGLVSLVIKDATKKKNVKNNPIGKKVTVHVDPLNPSNSTLINKIPIVSGVVLSAIFLTIGIFVFLFKSTISNLF